MQKDTLYVGGIVLLMCICAELLYLGRALTPRLTAALLALCLLIVHTRNNGIYLCLPLLVALAAALGRRYLGKLAGVTAVMLAVYAFTQGPLMEAVHCNGNETQEMLSVPFQQTARYVKQYPDEVTEEEQEAIEDVLIYDTLAERYEPYMSDAVKMQYRLRFADDDTGHERELLQIYFKTWAAQFQKHPLVYLEATANNIYGFIAPISYRVLGPVELNIDVDPALEHSVVDYTQPQALAPVRTLYCKLSTFVGKMPFFSLLYSPFVTTWIVCVGAVLLLRKKCWRAMVLYLPMLLNVAVCLLSPVNASTRYMLCATACLPLLLAVGLPLRHLGKLYNCAALLYRGEILGVVPKTNLPNYVEFGELRWFWLDKRAGQKSNVDPYLLSFSDNCASYEDDLLCSLDALTPWEWDIVWFLPAGPEDAQEVKLPAVKTPVQLKQAVGDAPAAYCLAFVREDELVYLLSDQCAAAGYRMDLSALPAAAAGTLVHMEQSAPPLFCKVPTENGKVSLLVLQKPENS